MGTNKKISLKVLFALQAVIVIYTLSGVFAKLASSQPFMSLGFILFYGLEIFILGIYALLWQQIIKRVDLSLAYANRAIAIIWSMLWAFLLFHESITLQNIIGVVIIVIGTMIVNSDHE
jgi:drug/metabolite transporter (DMT)-like permease